MKKFADMLRVSRRKGDEGASAVEYGLLIALIALIIAGAIALLGGTLNDKFSSVNDCVASDAASDCPGGDSGS